MLKNNYEPFSLDGINLTKYMFFTGKGGVIARADAEKQWLEKVKQISSDNFVAIPWFQDASIENIVDFSGGSKSDE